MPSIKNKPSQFCQLCSKRRANTREHLPPQAAFNAGEVHIKYIDSTSPSGSIQFRVLESNNGFWVPNLCDSCNHKVGFRYGDSYSVFATQVKGYELIEGNNISSFGRYSFIITSNGVKINADIAENFAAPFAFSE